VKVELALVGGGLANSLIAYRIVTKNPDFRLLVVEQESSLGANHTWSFHDSDLTTDQRRWLHPLVAHSWTRHDLRFPRRQRTIESGYNTVSSQQLHQTVSTALAERCLFQRRAIDLSAQTLRLDDGTLIEARAVIDGRGLAASPHLDVAYQKFVGLFLRLQDRHDLAWPILMDATIEQQDGYRFVYTLPLSEYDLLVEDTYYSDTPKLDMPELRTGILAYATRQGWTGAEVTGEEAGVLPIVLGGDIEGFWEQGPAGVPRSGMRAALFHPTTGYSLPEAVRLADEIAGQRDLESAALFRITKQRSRNLWRRCGFFRLLNRMLFRAAEPELRYRIFERFYGLSGGLIQRFYAGRLNWIDKTRLLIGKPPVPVHRALRCLAENRGPKNTLSSSSGRTQ
jgi:lycopene beta-cyclase